MKKLKDLNLNVIEDKSALTITGGCEGEVTEGTRYETEPGWMFSVTIVEYGDWEDTGCC